MCCLATVALGVRFHYVPQYRDGESTYGDYTQDDYIHGDYIHGDCFVISWYECDTVASVGTNVYFILITAF